MLGESQSSKLLSCNAGHWPTHASNCGLVVFGIQSVSQCLVFKKVGILNCLSGPGLSTKHKIHVSLLVCV